MKTTAITKSDFDMALPPIAHEGRHLFDARALHAWLGVGRDFTTWISRRISQYDFAEGIDFVCSPEPVSKGRGGHNRKSYLLTTDMAKELSMVERADMGRATRRYFIEMEKAAQDMAGHLLIY